MNLDDLFGGVILGGTTLVKAQVITPVRAARLPALRDLTAKLEALYDERLSLMMEDIDRVLANADARKALGLYVVDGGLSGGSDLRKAVLHEVQQPQFINDLFKAAPKTVPTRVGGNKSDQGTAQKFEHGTYSTHQTPKGKTQLTFRSHTGVTEDLGQHGDPKAVESAQSKHLASHGYAPTGKKVGRPSTGQKAERKEVTQATAGSRGGKYYVTASGKIRYGTKPQGEFAREADPSEIAQHLSHYRPLPFMGTNGNDAKLIKHLMDNGEELGFSDTDIQFLSLWYGAHDKKTGSFKGGTLFRDFRDMFKDSKTKKDGLTDDMLADDLSKLKLNVDGQSMSYQEAVMEFMKLQFWEGDKTKSEDERATYFHETIQPLMDDLFDKYEKTKTNPEVLKHMEDIGKHIEQTRYKFFFNAAQHDDAMKDLDEKLRQEPDPTKMTTDALAAMSALDMLFIPKEGERQVGRGAGHLKGVVSPNATLLDDEENPLLAEPHRLSTLNNSQLQMLYVASQLNGMWDGEQRKYDATSTMHSKLGDEALKRLARKAGTDSTQLSLVRKQLDESVKTIAQQLNDANTGKNPLLKKFIEHGADVLNDSTAADKIRSDMADLEELRTKALEAQKNDEFELPKSMADGRLGAVHQKTPLPHQLYTNDKGEQQAYGMFKHQRQGINWMLAAKRGVLAFDAGMGKTPTVITFLEHLRETGKMKEGEQAMIFLPPSVMNQWPKEINDYAPGVKNDEVLNLAGLSLAQRKEVLKSDVAKQAKYILVSTGTLNGGGEKEGADIAGGDFDDGVVNDGTGGTDDEMTELLKSIQGPVFIDEVHTGGFKEAGTVRHEIAKKVMDGREYSFGMTATPMPNGPSDLFHLGNLFAPGKIGTADEWAGATHGVQWNDGEARWEVGNPEGLQEMRDKVRPFVFHKLITDPEVVKDVGSLLGEKHEDPDLMKIQPSDDHPIWEYHKPGGKVDQLAQALFSRMVQEAEEAGDDDRLERLNKSAGFVRGGLRDSLRRQSEITPELFDPSYKGGSPKIEKFVADAVKHFKGGGGTQDKPLVMFSSLPGKAFPIVKRELVKAGIDPSLIGEIHGGKSARERAFEQDMTNAGKRKILLVGTKSGGAGLNLQKKANRVMYLDQPMDPASKRQAVGRVWRPGQRDTVLESNYTFTSPYGESWDEKSKRRLGAKQALVTAMMGDMDMQSLDFTQAANDALGGLGIKPEPQREPQKPWGNSGKKKKRIIGGQNDNDPDNLIDDEEADVSSMKISPEVEALARRMRPEKLMRDPEEEFEEDDDAPTLEEMLNPKTHENLISEAKGLAQKMNVGEEQRLWDRAFDMNAMPIKWRTQEVLLQSAKNTKQREEAKAGADRLAAQCLGWYRDLGKEAAVAQKQGHTDVAKKLIAQAEKFRNDMPDAFKQYKDPKDAVAALSAKATGAEPPPKKSAQEIKIETQAKNVKLAKEQEALVSESGVEPKKGEHITSAKKDPASGQIVVNLRSATGSREVKVPGKVQEAKDVLSDLDKQTGGKPAKGAVSLAKKSPFEADSHDHKIFTLLQKKGVTTEEEAKEAMKPYLAKLGVKKNELDKWASTMLKHFKGAGAFDKASAPKAEASAPKAEAKPATKESASLVGADDAKLGAAVQEAADNAPSSHGFGDDKVFVHRLYEKLKGRLGTMTMDQFKRKLVDLNRQRHVTLSRADVVGAMDKDDVKNSTIEDRGATFNFINRKRS